MAAAIDLPDAPGGGYDLITYFDSLHDLGDPRGALVRARRAVAPTGAVLLFEPVSGDTVADNLNPGGRMIYSISTLICTPNAVSQRSDDVLRTARCAGRRADAAGARSRGRILDRAPA